MEMIKVQESQEQDFFKWQEELVNRMEEQGMRKGKEIGKEIGMKKGRNETIKKLLKSMSPEEVSEKLEIPLNEIKLINKYF